MRSIARQAQTSFRRAFSTAKSYDTVIMGGGAMGSSIAYHLAAAHPGRKIAVVERDPNYKICSAMLSAGGIRQQFSAPENIKMSIYGAQFLKNIPTALAVAGQDTPDIQFHENGYLFLASERGVPILKENNRMQSECGATWMDLLEPSQLKDKFPWLKTEEIVLGSFGNANEGYFDPWAYVNALKKKSISMGVDYINAEVVGAKLAPKSASSISNFTIDSITVRCVGTSGREEVSVIRGNDFVNSSGAWSGLLLDKFIDGSSISNKSTIARVPVRPRKRCIFMVHCQSPDVNSIPPSTTPLTIDPTGVYFRPEGKGARFIVGVSPDEPNDPDCLEDSVLQQVDYHLFEEIIWPTLANRVPAFEALKLQSAWAGFYDHNLLDQNAIIGEHSEISNLKLCTGFSGHGLQQSPGAGRAISELITHNRFTSLDLSRFSFERIVNNRPIYETGIV